MKLETVKIVSETAEGGWVKINADEYNRHTHTLYVEKVKETPSEVEEKVVAVPEPVKILEPIIEEASAVVEPSEEKEPEKKVIPKTQKLSRTK